MSIIFFDRLIVFDEVEKEIKKISSCKEEEEELWKLVDEILHHRVLGCVLDKLPQTKHEEFLDRFHKAPYDQGLFDYLKEKIGENIEEIIKEEIGSLAYELLEDIKSKKVKPKKISPNNLHNK